MKKDVMKVMFFGDNSLEAGSSSIYSVIDGVFTHFFDNEAAYCVQPVDNSTFPNGHNSVLAAGDAVAVLRKLWGQSSLILRGLPMSQKALGYSISMG